MHDDMNVIIFQQFAQILILIKISSRTDVITSKTTGFKTIYLY